MATTSRNQPELPPIRFSVRPFRAGDEAACRALYREGPIAGGPAANDTGVDVDDIPGAYLSTGGGFWVAEDDAGVVRGMIGVQQHERDEGEIRRLRVRHDSRQRGIGSALMEEAVRFCRERQYLKVMLDTFIDREPAMKLFEKFKFRLHRTREVGNKTLFYFYLDIYSSDQVSKRVS